MKKLQYLIILLCTGLVTQAAGQDSLSAYVAMALENNPAILSAYEGFYSELSRVDQSGSLPDPTLGIGYFISPVETRVGPQQFRFSLSQMFPWFGTLSARRDQMSKQAEASYWKFALEARKVVRDVRATYYELWVLNELISLQESTLRLSESLESLATTRFRSGEGQLADVLLVQLDVKSLQNEIEQTRDLLNSRTVQFFLLLNTERSTLYLPDTIEADLPVFTPEDSLLDHPAVRASLAKSQAAEAYQEAARKQLYPSLGLGVDYMIIGKRDDMVVPDNGKNALMPMVTIGLPVWRKKYKSMQAEASALQRQYEAAARSENNNLLINREEAVYSLNRASRNMEVFSSQIDLAQRVLKLTETDFENDRSELDDILMNQEKLLQYRKKRLMAYGELLRAITMYEYVTGENPSIINELNDYENQN